MIRLAFAAIAGACLLPALANAEARLLVPGATAAGGDVERLVAKLGIQLVSPATLEESSIRAADAILLDRRSVAMLTAGGDALVATLEKAVEQGVGLVVISEAAASLPESEKYSKLTGRKSMRADARRPDEAGIAVEIPDQSHPITQCVSGLFFQHARALCEGDRGSVELASILGPEGRGPKVFWSTRARRGRIAVLALDIPPGAGPGENALANASRAREAACLAFLAGRAAEWALGSEVRLRIPGEMPLAVERLSPSDSGLLPGGAAIEGFYKGRQIAPVMGFQGADWLERQDREETEQPERVLDALAIAEGSTVADIGAGTGYFSFRMAKRVGAKGRVLASDLQVEMLELMRGKLAATGTTQIEPILATETDPRLPEGAVDLALMVDVYHELSKPGEVLRAIHRSLRTGSGDAKPGRLALVEYRGDDPEVAIKPLHRTTVQQIRGEVEPLGFRLVAVKDFLPHQNILVFEKRPSLVKPEK